MPYNPWEILPPRQADATRLAEILARNEPIKKARELYYQTWSIKKPQEIRDEIMRLSQLIMDVGGRCDGDYMYEPWSIAALYAALDTSVKNEVGTKV